MNTTLAALAALAGGAHRPYAARRQGIGHESAKARNSPLSCFRAFVIDSCSVLVLALVLAAAAPPPARADDSAAPPAAPPAAAARPLRDAIRAALAPALPAPRRLRLAVLPVEFADRKRDPRFTLDDLRRLVLSRGEYRSKSPTGEEVFGSVADYYDEVSCGRLAIEGDVRPWVAVRRPRASYEPDGAVAKGLGFVRFLTQALQALEAREGARALEGVDAVSFVIAGEHGKHGTVLWPHSAMLPWRGRMLRYYVMSEMQGGKFAPIGVHCHELGHVLGILDKYGEGKHAGLGTWCLMAVGHRADRENGDRRPSHPCAFCKERLGWLSTTTVDPRTPQTLRLAGIEGRADEALKVLIDPSGREYFLLENRRRRGFDAGIPRAGLLIWHVGEVGQALRNTVWPYSIDLEEAHGDETRKGPFHDLEKVPWPIPGRDAFTPWTTPGSTSWNLAALPVYVTGIREEGEEVVLTLGAPGAAGGAAKAGAPGLSGR
jgi:M6 family metalloprotease-like protein